MQSSTIDSNRSSMTNHKSTLSIALPSAMAQTVTPLHHILHALPLPELPLSIHRTNIECTKLALNDEEEKQTSTAIAEAARALSKDDNCMHFLHCAFEYERDKLSSQERQYKLKEEECEEQMEESEESEINEITEKMRSSSKANITKVAHDATVSVCHWLEDKCNEENEVLHQNDHHLQLLQANNVRQVNTDKCNAKQHASTTKRTLSEHENALAATPKVVMTSVEEVKQEIVSSTKNVNLQSQENSGNITNKNKRESEEVLKMQNDINDDEIKLKKPTATIITAAIVPEENVNTKDSMVLLQSTEIARFMSILAARDKYTMEDMERFVKEMTITQSPFATVVNAEVVASSVEVLLEQCQVTHAVQASNQYKEQLQDKKCNNNDQEHHEIKEENSNERVTDNEFTWWHAVHASALLWTVNRLREHLLLAGSTTSTDQSNKQEEEGSLTSAVTVETTNTSTTNLPLPAPALRSCVMSTLIDAFYHIVHNTHHLMTRLHNEPIYDDTKYCYKNPEEREKLQNDSVNEENSASNREGNDKENTICNKCMNWRKWAECIRMFARSFAALLQIAYLNTEQITHDVWLINDVECDRIEQICTYSLFCVPTLCEKDTYCEYTSYVMENIVNLYKCVYRYKHEGNDKNICSGSCNNDNNNIESVYPSRFFAHVLPSPHLLQQTWSETILVYSANNLSVKQDSRKLSCLEQRKFSLITICMLSAVQSLFSTRYCSLTEIDSTASKLAENKESTERIINDAKKLQRTCIAWANTLWHHFLYTPNTLYEDKEVLIIRCNVINCIFKELSMLISCPTWPAANLLLHECVNVFSREVHASIARSVTCCSMRKHASSRSSKQELNLKCQTKRCKELKHEEMEEEDEQVEQEKENVKMPKRNKVSTKNKNKSATVDKVKTQCMCEEDVEDDNYKDIKETTNTDVQNAEINKNTNLLHIAVIDAIAQVIIELIIVRTQITSKYTMKNIYVSKTQEEESETNDKCLQVFAQHISQPLAKHEHKVQRNTRINTPMKKNDEVNSEHDCNDNKNDTNDKSLQTIIEFIFDNIIIEGNKRQTGNGSYLENRCSSRCNYNNNNNNNMENDNDTLYQHLLSWISSNNVSSVNRNTSIENELSQKSVSRITDSNNNNHDYHTVQKASDDKLSNFMEIALHAMESAKRKKIVMQKHITSVNLREQMLQEMQQEQCTTEQKKYANGVVHEAILVTQLTLPESMLSRHMEEQLIYFLLSLLQCSYEANDANEESNEKCIKDDDDDEANADLCDDNVHGNDDTTASKENKIGGKRANKYRMKDRNSKTIQNNKSNKNELIVIADSLVKRIIYHFTQLCLSDRSMTHFIWSQLKSFVRSNNARIREAVVPLITFLIHDCLSKLSNLEELEEPLSLTSTNCSLQCTQQNGRNNNLLHSHNATFVTEMISTLLYLLEDRSVMVVTRVISSFHILLSLLDQLDNCTQRSELRSLEQQQSQCIQDKNSQCVENFKQGDFISPIEREQLLLFIQYKLLKCFAETKHTRHQNDIAHLFVKRWLSMLNTEQDEMYNAHSLENVNIYTINANRNNEKNTIRCYAIQTTPVEFATKSSLTSHVLNSHAQLAREWMTLITKLATTSSDHSDNSHVAAAAPYTAANNKTSRTQYGSTMLPTITKEHPFCQLLSLLLHKSCCESRTLPHKVLERGQQDLNVQEGCHSATVTKTNSCNNNNLYTKKKNDFTIEEIEHLLRSICRAVWTRFTCCVSANDAFSCLTTIHVIVMVNASSVCQLVSYMLPYLSLSSEQNPLRHSSADLYGGVLLQLCQIIQIILTDSVHCTEHKKEVKSRYNKSKRAATLAMPNVLSSDVDDCLNSSTRHMISKDLNNNISNWKGKTNNNTLSFTTLDALSVLFNTIIAKYVGVYQQRIIVAACGALTALIPLGEHHPSVEKASMTLLPNQMPTTTKQYLQTFSNETNMKEWIPISPYLLMCYKLMDGYYTRIYLLLPSLSTDYKNIAYIQRFLFLLSEFLRNYRGWTNAALQKQLQDVCDANMYNSFNVNENSSSYKTIDTNSVTIHAPLASNTASENTWEDYLSHVTVVPLAAGNGICPNVFTLVLKIMRCASADTLIKLQVIVMRVMSSLCMLAPQIYFIECKEYITQSLLPEASIALQIQGLTLLRDFLRDEAERVYLAPAPPSSTSVGTSITTTEKESTRTHKVDSTVIVDNTNITETNKKNYRRQAAKLSKSVALEAAKEECSIEEKHETQKQNNDNSIKANVSNRRQRRHTAEKHNMQSESDTIATNECTNELEDKLQILSSKFDFADENSGMAAWLMQSYHELIATLCIHSVSKMVRELCIEIMCACANDGLLPPSKYLPSLIALCNDVDGAIRSRAQQFLYKSTEFVQCSESLSVAAVPGILHGYILSCSCKADVIENITPCANVATMNNVTSSMSYHTLFTLLTYRERHKVRSALLRYFYETDKLSAWWKNLPLIRDNIEQANVSKGNNNSNHNNNGTNADTFVFTIKDNSQQTITQELNLLSFLVYLSVVITFSSLSNASQLEQTNLCNECITGINLHGESALEMLTNACKQLSELQSEVMLDKVSVASSEGGLAKTRNSQKSKKRSKKEVRSQELTEMEEKQQEAEWEECSYDTKSTKECTHHNNSSDETNAADRSAREVIAESQCIELLQNLSLERLALSEAISVVLLHYIYTTIQHFHSVNGMRSKEQFEHHMEFQPIAQAGMKINNTKPINNGSVCASFTAGQVQVALLFIRNVRLFTQKIAPLVSCMHANLADNNTQTEDIHLSHKHCFNKKCIDKVNNKVDCTIINEVADALHFLRDELQRTLCDDTLQDMHTSSHRHCIKRTKTNLSSAKTKQTVSKVKLQREKVSKRNTKQSQRKRKRSTSSESSSESSTLTSSAYSSDKDDYYSSSSSSSSSCASSMSSSD